MTLINDIASYMNSALFMFAAISVLEMLAPAESQSLKGRVMGLTFWSIWILVTVTGLALFHKGLSVSGVKPLINIPLDFPELGISAIIVAPIASAFISDFFFYWFHRLQHVKFWKFHSIHHSIQELNVINSYHHISEVGFRTVFLLLPMAFLNIDMKPILPIVAVIIHAQESFIHSSTRMNYGALRYLIVDNRYHRIHHSVEEKHFDKNFAAFTPFWDVIFRTAHFPSENEWPETGVKERREPRSVREWLMIRDFGKAPLAMPIVHKEYQ